MKDVRGRVLIDLPRLGEPGNDLRRVVITLVGEGIDQLTPRLGSVAIIVLLRINALRLPLESDSQRASRPWCLIRSSDLAGCKGRSKCKPEHTEALERISKHDLALQRKSTFG